MSTTSIRTPYLDHVHDISLDACRGRPDLLAARIADLPGRKIVYTNGSAPYAARVVDKRGLGGSFDAIYGVEHAGFRPKPQRAAFDAVFARRRVTPTARRCSRTTRATWPPRTPWACAPCTWRRSGSLPHIHHHTDDLTGFLALLP